MRGKLAPEDSFFNVRTGKAHKANGALSIKGAETENATSIEAGDMFAVSKLEELALGDTVTAESDPVSLPSADYPPTTFSLAVTPKARGDEQKINEGLDKLSAEDPTFLVGRSAETGELVVQGMSQLHIEVQQARLQRRYGVETEGKLPKIPYQETVMAKAEGHHRHKKQSGGRGQFAEVYLRAAPRESGAGFEFIDSIVGGSIPRQFIPEV